MPESRSLSPVERIERSVLLIRNQKVMLEYLTLLRLEDMEGYHKLYNELRKGRHH